ncbi:MAG: N-acetyl-gamma-glutamyl-phosphate reductase [Deltaproteobacteria bacterium]|nr:N-acetyl-gamma-glutamyl-phosphate reductase [Deltaproteobacteria bacterium]
MSNDNQNLSVAVLGAAGYVGGELLRVLTTHPNVGEIVATSRSNPGAPWGAVHPALAYERARTFSDASPVEAAQGADVVFLALGHGESSSVMPEILATEPRLVIDLGADFRLSNEADYKTHYGDHPHFDLCETFVYGLPEARRSQIKSATRIANPGCMATASELTLLPLAAAKILPERSTVFAVTGSSGAGAKLRHTTHHPYRAANMFNYKPLAHQHEAEINRLLGEVAGRSNTTRMIAHSGPLVRGIHATAHIVCDKTRAVNVPELYKTYYDAEPFTHVLDAPPALSSSSGVNHAYLHVTQKGDEVLVTCVIDNLMKGAAGQAVQNMNIALGLPETAGLTAAGFFPY